MKNIQFSVKLDEKEYLKLAFLANKRVVGVGTLGRMIIHNYLTYPAQAEDLLKVTDQELAKYMPKKKKNKEELIDPNQMEIKE